MVYYESEYSVNLREADPWGRCRPSGVLSLLQEAATGAAAALGLSHETLVERYHVFWVLARVWYRLDRPLAWGERVKIRTWHRGGRGVSTYRDFDLSVDGRPVGEAVSLWALADAQTHKLARMSLLQGFGDSAGGELCKKRTLTKLPLPAGMEERGERIFRYSDLDINGHVNNAKYADFVCDALCMEQLGPERFVSSLQVGYQAECRAGETVRLFTGQAEGMAYVHGADGAGKTRFDAAVEIARTGELPFSFRAAAGPAF